MEGALVAYRKEPLEEPLGTASLERVLPPEYPGIIV